MSKARAMRFTIAAGRLAEACGRLKAVVARGEIPVLGNLLIEAAPKKGVTLTATDLDVVMRLELLAKVEAAGAATADAGMLFGFASKTDKSAEIAVEMDPETSRLKLSAGRSRLSLVTLPAEDFPAAEAAEFTHEFALAPADLAGLLAAGLTVSTEEARYYLAGVYLHVVPGRAAAPPPAPPHEGEGGRLRAVATDGHRLARVDCDVEVEEGQPGVIVPRKTVRIAAALCDEAGADDGEAAEVEVQVSASRIRFDFPGCRVTSKVIDGTFPDYWRVIPEGNAHVVTADRKALIAALDRVAVLASDKGHGVKLVATAGALRLEARNPAAGEGLDEIDAAYEGPDLPERGVEIGFNSKYLGETLRQVAGESVAIAIADAGTPAVFTGAAGGAGALALYVIMPMRV